MRPKASSVDSAMASVLAGSPTSVGTNRVRSPSESATRLAGGLVELGDDHVGALRAGPGRRFSADASACAGDDGCAVGESLSFGHMGVLQSWGSEHPA